MFFMFVVCYIYCVIFKIFLDLFFFLKKIVYIVVEYLLKK